MGRKLNQASTKISKSENNKKQMNSLINVLRPKVYITDSSNFKNLVQQLTGNNISNPTPFVQEQVIMEEMPIINIDNIQNHGYNESHESSEGSFPSFSNSPQSMLSSYTSLANSPQSYSEMYTRESSEGSFPSFSNSPQSRPNCNYTSLANSPQSMPSCYTSLTNSPQSIPTCTYTSSPQESFVSETTFNVLDSSFASMPSCNYTSSPQESYVSETTFNVLENTYASNDLIASSSFGGIESWLLEIDSFSCNWDSFDDHIPAAMPELSVYCSDFENLW